MKITMEHGSGGRATGELIKEIFEKSFDSDVLSEMEDSAVVPGAGRLAVTTDSFVVTPLEYPGGDIGRLCVCGTVNDLLMRGAVPMYLTCGFILQEGADVDTLKRVVRSMAATAKEAGIKIVAGDTKVIEGGTSAAEEAGMFINTAGVGFVPDSADVSSSKCAAGDAVIVSGNLGDHHAAILSCRMEIENTIKSDNAPLNGMVSALMDSGANVHAMRDITRGGLATVLKELAEASGVRIEIDEEKIPVDSQVQGFCGLLGLDPLYMGNEGKMAVIVDTADAERALAAIRKSPYGEDAVLIGRVTEGETGGTGRKGSLILNTAVGGHRILDIMQGEGLPRIC